MSDLVIDFENHLKHGNVYLAEVDLELQDAPDDVPSSITADVYVIATNHDMAQFIVSQMYPDYLGLSINLEPITEYEYAARRNRSVL
jgi:hypothetical protein